MKSNRFQLKDIDIPSFIIDTEGEFAERIERLKKEIRENQKEIAKINEKAKEEEIKKIDKHFHDNQKELEALVEVRSLEKSEEISELETMYKEVQQNYLSVQMNRVIYGMSEITKRMEKEQKVSKLAFENIKKKTNDITSNILFSAIAIVLGISLVTSMITGIQKLDMQYLFVYFVSIGWLAVMIMGTAYLLVREYDQKSKSILVVVCLFTCVLFLVMYFTFS